MRTLAVVTARSGSKGVPDKNIRQLAGYSLLEWSIMACKKVELIDHVFLSTDSKKYAEIGKEAGAEVPFLRPEHLASDQATDLEVFTHFVDWMATAGMNYEGVLHIRPTTPLRDPAVIQAAIEMYFLFKDQITSLRSIQEMSESAYKSFEVLEKGLLKPILAGSSLDDVNAPRQSFPKTYTANGYVDIVKPTLIKELNQFHGTKIMSFLTPSTIEIDTEDDLTYVSWKVAQDPNLMKKIFETQ
jgi:CMP-N-acetylneuraminic acid synthetase